MKIVVLAGGLSPERNVSLSSGVMVAEALRSRGHRVALVDQPRPPGGPGGPVLWPGELGGDAGGGL